MDIYFATSLHHLQALLDRSYTQWQRYLAVSHSKLASVYEWQGQIADTLQELTKGRDIIAALPAIARGNVHGKTTWHGSTSRLLVSRAKHGRNKFAHAAPTVSPVLPNDDCLQSVAVLPALRRLALAVGRSGRFDYVPARSKPGPGPRAQCPRGGKARPGTASPWSLVDLFWPRGDDRLTSSPALLARCGQRHVRSRREET